jgi:hypothetical protein
LFESEKFLWSNHNQWLSKWHSHVSSQEMEIVGSGWWPAYLHISLLKETLSVIGFWILWQFFVLVTHLQVSLNSAWWVLWSSSIIAVRQ